MSTNTGISATDLFCGAGGSSVGAAKAGVTLVMAANHWSKAIEVHQENFPEAGHDCADISQVDPRRYRRTNILMASPECTNHSNAKGQSRKAQNAADGNYDPAAERSRSTMWDVVRFAECHLYDAIVVENVVECTKWVLFEAWLTAMLSLGYTHKVLSHNSMHHGVPQSRDRIYIVFYRKGITPDLELELTAFCQQCEVVRPCRQVFKVVNGQQRTVGKHREQYAWRCTTCQDIVLPDTDGAESIIDWSLDAPVIRDRKRPLASATMERIQSGIDKYGPDGAFIHQAAGNVFQRAGSTCRSKALTDPVGAQTTTSQHALVTTSPFLVQTAHDGPARTQTLDQPHPTVCASDDRQSLVVPPQAFLVRNYGGNCKPEHTVSPISAPTGTITTADSHALVVPMRGGGSTAKPVTEALATVTAGGNHHGLLVPYNGKGQAAPTSKPMGTQATHDRFALVPAPAIDALDCGFRMLTPAEVGAAMAFPRWYQVEGTAKDKVKLYGNAVTPPVMYWIVGRLVQALEAA